MTAAAESYPGILPHARMALSDARHAFELAQDASNDINGKANWRVPWVATITLLRSVGYILGKVESKRSKSHADILSFWWKSLTVSKPEPIIFWNFIDKDRHLILKQYAFHVEMFEHNLLKLDDGSYLLFDDGNYVSLSGGLIITDGPFEGRSGIEICGLALEWWAEQLTSMENLISPGS